MRQQVKRLNRLLPRVGLVLALTTLFALQGCTSIHDLTPSKSPKVKDLRSGTINVASRATGIDTNIVGKTTLLTLPIGSIRTRGDTSAQLMQSVEVALQAAGYNNVATSPYSAKEGAYIKMHVEDIALGNFLASTWATVVVHVRLETRDGALLWKKRLRTSINALNNYNRTATVAMNELVKDMAEAFTEEDFYTATQRVKRHNDFINESSASAQP